MKVVSNIKFKHILTFFLIITLILSSKLFIGLINSKFYIKEFNYITKVNYKDDFVGDYGNVCYGNKFKCKDVAVSVEGIVDTTKLDEYEIKYTYSYNGKEKTLTQIVNVVDNEAPNIELITENISVCPNGKYDKLKYKANDNYDGDLTDKVIEKLDNNIIYLTVSDSNNNETIKKIDIERKDIESPKITVNGAGITYIKLNSEYKDLGVSVKDNCDKDINIEVSNNVNTKKEGRYVVKYTATDSSNNKSTKERIVYVQKNPKKSTSNIKDKNTTGSKIIYLTFDDGPSIYTPQLLDILKKYDVKATFFVTGNGNDDVILREYQEGHTIGLHSYTHKYNEIYLSIENYYKDLYKIKDRVKKITGYEPTLIRFPGGSSNTISKKYDNGIKIMSFLSSDVQNKGFYYFDWNVSSEDAGAPISSDAVYKNVVTTLKSEVSVVLQHDTKKFSIDAVERIIKFGLENGYTFEPLTEDSYGAHHKISN